VETWAATGMVYGQNPADRKSNTVLELSRMGKDAMLRLTDEELSRVQDLCRVLPPWKRGEFLQELTRRLQGRELNHADLRCGDGDACGARSRPRLGAGG
jgi:hypothetical protein